MGRQYYCILPQLGEDTTLTASSKHKRRKLLDSSLLLGALSTLRENGYWL